MPQAQPTYEPIVTTKSLEQSWALQPSVVYKSINLGTANAHIIDLALKNRSRDVIRPAGRGSKLWQSCDVIQASTSVCLLFLECPTLSY